MKGGKKGAAVIVLTAILLLVLVFEAGALYKMVSTVVHGESPRQIQENGPIEPLDLSGEWVQTNDEAGSGQCICIAGEVIEIYEPSADSYRLYWSGTYTPPANRREPYRWKSKSTPSRTGASPACSDGEKSFTYKDGKLTYTIGEKDEKVKIEAEKGTWGSEKVLSPGGQSTEGNRMAETGDIGLYHVEIGDARLAQDMEGNAAVIITYAWTNHSEATASAMVMLMERAYQDGVQLTSALTGGDTDYDSEAVSRPVFPGGTLTVQRAFQLANDTGAVTFEVSEFLSHTGDAVVKEYDLQALE